MPRSATELATFLNAELHGDGHHVISGVAAPERAGPQDLIYVDSDRYLDAARRAGAPLVVGDEVQIHLDIECIKAKKP